jgi:hypothetical protein
VRLRGPRHGNKHRISLGGPSIYGIPREFGTWIGGWRRWVGLTNEPTNWKIRMLTDKNDILERDRPMQF